MTREQPDRPTREIQEEVNKEFGPDVTRAGYGACTLRRRKLGISASNTARRSIGPKPLLNRSTESLVPKPLSSRKLGKRGRSREEEASFNHKALNKTTQEHLIKGYSYLQYLLNEN